MIQSSTAMAMNRIQFSRLVRCPSLLKLYGTSTKNKCDLTCDTGAALVS